MLAKLPRKRLTCISLLVSLGVALTLVYIKIWAWLETGSIALLISVADGLVDVMTSMATLMGVYYTQRPADHGHHFSYGKAEAIAEFVQVMLLAAAGVALGIASVSRLITPQKLVAQGLGIIVIIVSTICTSLLVTMQTLVVKYTQSTAIAADRAHYFTDIAVNIAMLCTLVLDHQFGWIQGKRQR